MLKLIDTTSGEIYFDGIPLKDLIGYPFKVFRRQAQMIFQDPYSSLDPRFTLGASLEEPLIIQKITKSEDELEELHRRAMYYYQNPLSFSYADMLKGISVEERKINKENIGGEHQFTSRDL